MFTQQEYLKAARIYEEINYFNDADNCFSLLIENDKNISDANLYENHGDYLARRGLIESAIKAYQKAVGIYRTKQDSNNKDKI